VGWKRSAAVVRKFKTVRQMMEASEKEWMEVDGIGKGIAKKTVEALR